MEIDGAALRLGQDGDAGAIAAGDRRTRGRLVIGPSSAVRTMPATRPLDFSTSTDGLAMLVRKRLGAHPSYGTVFAFRSERFRLPFFDSTEMMLVAKRLQAGAFRWPKPGGGALQVTAAEMAALADGLDRQRVTGGATR